MKAKTGVTLVLLAAFVYVAAQEGESEQNVVEELLVETLVKPETCSITSEMGDTLQIHYTGKLLADGKVIDSSLSRDPLVVELGKRTVIPGLEQSLVGVCEGQKIKTTIPPHLAYGKRGYPPTIPADAALEFEVEVILILYLMISSVVGFYSSPLFTGLRPRAQDTTLTQVHTHTHTHCSLSLPWGILIITQLSSSLFSDYWELCFSIGAQLSSACIF
uniref:peptidylprolyl isomerase n=1 Tax=Oncorhynchus kisutch TaxID=8019 RepID=A0A8C7CSB9_ONCKI